MSFPELTPKIRAALWPVLRKKLKKEFEAKGVTRCEMCGTSNALSFAHRKKMRFIDTVEELRQVALLCTMRADGSEGCHTRIEHSGHSNMFTEITNLISRREESQTLSSFCGA